MPGDARRCPAKPSHEDMVPAHGGWADLRRSWMDIGASMLMNYMEACIFAPKSTLALLLIVYAVSYTIFKASHNCLNLTSAAKNGDVAAVKHALNTGVRADCRGYWDQPAKTPLHWAAIMGHEAVTRALVDGRQDLKARCQDK